MGAGTVGWLAAMPIALVAAGWLVLPGLPLTLALGLRGVLAWALAPPVAVAFAAVTAVAAAALGLRWSVVVALVPALVVAAVAAAVRFGMRRSRCAAPATEPDGRRSAVCVVTGLTGALILAALTARLGMGTPDALSQTYDAVFHYNAVAQVLANHDGSSLAVGTLNVATSPTAFYPAAWHDLVSLVVLSTGASIPLASNTTAMVVAGLVWPLSCLALVRRVVGRSAPAALATPLVSVGFIAFPWTLMSFGVLWPNLLGLALLPAALAVVAALCRLGEDNDSGLTRPRATFLLLVALAALGLAHPNTVLSLGALSVPILLWVFVRWLLATVDAGRWWLAGSITVAVLAVASVGSVFLATSPLFNGVRAHDWPAYQKPAQAVGEVLLNATNHRDAAWAISAVTVLGLVAAARKPATSWLVPAYLIAGGLFVLASALENPTAALLTGFWYNDSYRLAAMVPVIAVPLAVIGLLSCGSAVAGLAVRPKGHAATRPPAEWPATAVGVRSRLRRSTAGTAVILLCLFAASSGMYVREHAEFLAVPYGVPNAGGLVDSGERAFFARIATQIPPDVVVAQNPWTGSALLWALEDDRVLFPHMTGEWTADQLFLAGHLRDAFRDPAVCGAAARLRVGYLLVGKPDFWPWDGRAAQYPGLTAPSPGDSGFRLVEDDGRGNQLYRLTACGAS
jgi:hypothetical protein